MAIHIHSILRRLARRWLLLTLACLIVACVLVLNAFVEFTDTGDHEGFYLLRGEHKRLEIKDDLFLGDRERLIFDLPLEGMFNFFRGLEAAKPTPPYLVYEWQNRSGRGFVYNELGAGRTLLTCFGRYRDSQRRVPSGLFVGGGLPYREKGGPEVTLNDTGMAYFDGRNWNHVWCSVNEMITPAYAASNWNYPGSWTFLDSSVLLSTPRELVIESSHRLMVDGEPLRMDRYAFFRAGDTYFVLLVKIRNTGQHQAGYYYVYGDEPWVGEYGSSSGDVGWYKNNVQLYEGPVDTAYNSFIGMYDLGNSLVNEGYNYSRMANFLEWMGDNRPEFAYFSNGAPHAPGTPIRPLDSVFGRSLFAQWGPCILQPGQAETYTLAIGMASVQPNADIPEKPSTYLSPDQLAYVK